MKISQQEQIDPVKNPKNYLSLEAQQHGDNFYHNHYVGLHKVSSSLIKVQELPLIDTAKEQDGAPYLGKITYTDAERITIFPNPRIFVDFLNALYRGKEGKKQILDAVGNALQQEVLRKAWNEVLEKRFPWRGEYLNHAYSNTGRDLFVTYNISKTKSTLEHTEPLEDCLMEDVSDMDIFDWLDRANSQGLPPRDVARTNIKENKLNYCYPRTNSVARFGADADRVGLVCVRVPQGSSAGLGVRAVFSIGNISTKIFQEKSRLEEALEDIEPHISPISLPQVREALRKYF